MSQLPEPLTPEHCDLRSHTYFPLHYDRLLRSKWWRRASDFARSRNVDLWSHAFREVPAASLPDDDADLADLAGFGRDIAAFQRVKRDLTGKVKERTRVKLVRSSSSHDGSHEQRAQTDAEIIEEASETQVTVVKTHRRDIAIGRRIVSTLFGELMEATEQRHEIAEAVEEVTAKDKDGKRRAMMHRAVALPSRAATAQSLANAMKTLVTLERQAFNIETDASDEEVAAARRIVNGTDKADLIAGYALTFQAGLQAGSWG